MLAEMKRARHLLATCGWVGPELEPMSATLEGRPCMESYEGVASFSVMGALLEAHAWPEGWHLMEAAVAPSTAARNRFNVAEPTLAQVRHFQKLCRAAVIEGDMQAWLNAPGRTESDVLRLFVEGIKRSRKMGANRG